MRFLVGGTSWVKQRDEEIDIQKSDAHSSSARNRLMSSSVGFLAPLRGVKRGTPLRILGGDFGSNASRTTFEITTLMVVRRWVANSFATSSRSSSRSTVVRIT